MPVGLDPDGRSEAEHGAGLGEPVVELRHEAGLTAGQTLPLPPGRYRFGPLRSSHGGLVNGSPEALSFELTVSDAGDTTLSTGGEPVAVEGVVIDRPVPVDPGDVVQLTTDHFVLDSATRSDGPRSPVRSVEPRAVASVEPPRMTGWFGLCAVVIIVGLALAGFQARFIGLALIGLAGLIGVLLVRDRRTTQLKHARTVAVTNARSLLFNDVIEVRKSAADALRAGAPTPSAVARAVHAPPIRTPSKLTATVASGDRAWEPPIVVRRSPGWNHGSVVDDLSFLPAIPFTVDLDAGPIAVVGPRQATLAVARHLATTALAMGGPDAGVDVDTSVPADWRWLVRKEHATLRILDHTDGALGARTVALDATTDDLRRRGFDLDGFVLVMEIDDSGRATISTGAEDGGTGFVPHGITEQHAKELQQLLVDPPPEPREASSLGIGDLDDEHHGDTTEIDDFLETVEPTEAGDAPSEPVVANEINASGFTADSDVDASKHLGLEVFETDRLLVTGRDRSKNKDVLATAALQQAKLHPDRKLYILDRGDRALIRLAQLESCVRYTTLDRVDGVQSLVDELDRLTARPAAESGLLLAPDLWSTIAFYRESGHLSLADRIDELVAKMEIVPVAASASDLVDSSAAFLVWIDTSSGSAGEVHRQRDTGVIDLRTLPGIDLTGSVARLAIIPKQETPS